MTEFPISAQGIKAAHECLRVLSQAGDLGRDTAFVQHQARREVLTSGQATSLRTILARHADHLPADLLAAAISDEPPPVRRGPGRPRLGADILSSADRTRRRRAAARMVAVEIPAEVADRLRAARDTRGVTMGELLAGALDTIEAG